MKTLKETVTLLPDSGTKAVTELAHITPAIIANITIGSDEETVQNDIRNHAYTSLMSDFDAEFGKHKQVARFVDVSTFTPFTRKDYQALGSDGTTEVLTLAQPLPYSSLRLRRLLLEASGTFEGATITVTNLRTGDTQGLQANIAQGFNKIPLETNDLPFLVDADSFPLNCQIKIEAEGLRLRPIQASQLSGLVKRETHDNLLIQTQWELIVDMQKIANDFVQELAEAYWYKMGVVVLGWHLKSQRANNSTIVGREEIAANREELKGEYKKLLCSAVKNIMPALETTKATRNDLRFDVGYSVGSLV